MHTAVALAVLAALDAELADNAEQLGLEEPLEWSAAWILRLAGAAVPGLGEPLFRCG